MTLKTISRAAIATAFCLVSHYGAARAQSATVKDLPPEANNPAVISAWLACRADIDIYCADVRLGGGRIVQCLIDNKMKLSKPCIFGMLDARQALGR
jgi:Cysteine rich repeat